MSCSSDCEVSIYQGYIGIIWKYYSSTGKKKTLRKLSEGVTGFDIMDNI